MSPASGCSCRIELYEVTGVTGHQISIITLLILILNAITTSRHPRLGWPHHVRGNLGALVRQTFIAEGSRIWPEYRLHSINFAFRSISCMLVTMGEKALGREDRPMNALNALIVLAGAAGASAGSASVGTDNRSNSIRDLDGPAWFKFFFSWAQFIATTNCLIGQRRFSLQFVYVFVIQFTAFLMTLRRKNLAPHYPLVATYGAILAFALGVALYETSYFSSVFMVLSLTNLAALGRMASASTSTCSGRNGRHRARGAPPLL